MASRFLVFNTYLLIGILTIILTAYIDKVLIEFRINKALQKIALDLEFSIKLSKNASLTIPFKLPDIGYNYTVCFYRDHFTIQLESRVFRVEDISVDMPINVKKRTCYIAGETFTLNGGGLSNG